MVLQLALSARAGQKDFGAVISCRSQKGVILLIAQAVCVCQKRIDRVFVPTQTIQMQ